MVANHRSARDTSGQEGLLTILKGCQSYLHADAYPRYDRLYKQENIIEVACWFYARSKFHEAALLTKKPHRAHIAVEYIRKLCVIEREIKEQRLTFDEIKQYRQKYSKLILTEYKQWLDRQINAVSAGAFKNALKYTLNQRVAQNTYLEQGYLKMDNDDSER